MVVVLLEDLISVNKPVEVITEDESSAKGRLTSVLYPNPFDNEVNIRIVEGYDEAEVEVFNMLGQRVSQQFFRENALMKISLDNVESGQYFIKVKVDNQIIMKRAIKK